jgi:uncharacterized delta-60 repeat protein
MCLFQFPLEIKQTLVGLYLVCLVSALALDAAGQVAQIPTEPFSLERGSTRSHPAGGARRSELPPLASLSARQPWDGELDPTFAPVIDSRPGFAYAVETQPDGKLLVGGGFKSFNGFPSSGIVRLNANRSVDSEFSATIRGTVFAIALQPDGKIVIGGTFYSVNGVARSAIARLNSDGSLDTGFNPGNRTRQHCPRFSPTA